MAIKAVLFDIDGTLVDSNDFHVNAWEGAFRRFGARLDLGVIHHQIGKGADMLIPSLLPQANKTDQEKLSRDHDAAFKGQYLKQVKAFPGARDLLVRVQSAGRKVVLASSASKEELHHYLDLLDARDIVAATTSADDVDNTKPAPDIFAKALVKMAPLSADEAIVVGDTPYDVEAAAKCGIAAIGLRSGGFPDEALRKAGAIALYDDVASLLAGYDASPLAG